MSEINISKKCTKCGDVKPLDAFLKSKISKDGKRPQCKECDKNYRNKNKERRRKYIEKNKDHIKNQRKEYYDNNKDNLNKKKRKYYKENKDKMKKYYEKNKDRRKIYYEENKENILTKNKEYRDKNKDILSVQSKKYYEENKDIIHSRIKEYRKTNQSYIKNQRKKNYEKNRNDCGKTSMFDNKKCALYLGVVVAERLMKHVFNDVKMMPNNNPGYDMICNKGKKIDVKSSSLHVNRWGFNIRYNKICDYFLCIAFDNRIDLNPIHVWMIPAKDVNHLSGLTFYQSNVHKWDKWKLDIKDVVNCCTNIKG